MDTRDVIEAYEKKQAILVNAKFILQNSGDIDGAMDCELELAKLDTTLDQLRHLGPDPASAAVSVLNVSDKVKEVCMQPAKLSQKIVVDIVKE
jgi:hypothetical protein